MDDRFPLFAQEKAKSLLNFSDYKDCSCQENSNGLVPVAEKPLANGLKPTFLVARFTDEAVQ